MPNEIWAAIGAALGTLTLALLTYLTARLQQSTSAIEQHTAVTAAATKSGVAVRPAPDRRGGGGAARDYPRWNQLQDPDPSGALPAARWDECGEECCAEVVYRQHGVPVEADYLRYLLRGPGGQPLTTAQDLVAILAKCNVDSVASTPPAAQLQAAVLGAVREGRAVILLGRWDAPTVLHWILATSADTATVGVNDPWGGVRKQLSWTQVTPLYAGEIVTVTRKPDA